MAVRPNAEATAPDAAWALGGTGTMAVYRCACGERVALLLHLSRSCGVMLLNDRVLNAEGRRVAMGWGLAIAEFGADGYYAVFLDQPA